MKFVNFGCKSYFFIIVLTGQSLCKAIAKRRLCSLSWTICAWFKRETVPIKSEIAYSCNSQMMMNFKIRFLHKRNTFIWANGYYDLYIWEGTASTYRLLQTFKAADRIFRGTEFQLKHHGGMDGNSSFTKDWLQVQWSSILAGFINYYNIIFHHPKEQRCKHFSVPSLCMKWIPLYFLHSLRYLCKETSNGILAIVGLKLSFSHLKIA